MFTRRDRAPVTDDAPTPAEEPVDLRKGRATPKRRDAERERRERIRPPRDSKAAAKLTRERKLAERKALRDGAARGEARYLPPRDQGPVRKFIRDSVDARISAAEFFLPGALVILVLLLTGSDSANALGSYIWSVLVVVIAFDSMILTTRLRREIRRRFPEESRRGATAYTLMRALTWRGMRTPKPQVRRGAKP